jgi:hypothetical protein
MEIVSSKIPKSQKIPFANTSKKITGQNMIIFERYFSARN